jgi:hypothetical protein
LHGIDFRLTATGVIAGRVLGEDNEPRVRANVQACTPRYVEGERRLIGAASIASTNDLGEYRIYGLAPGRYYVGVYGEDPDEAVVAGPAGAPPEERYLPTLYPNVPDVGHASMVDVLAGGEARGIDIAALKSRTFHVRGKIPGFGPTDQHTRVQLGAVEGICDIAARGADIAPDTQGNFDFAGVTPGAYVVMTSFVRRGSFESASRLIRVVDADLDDVSLVPSAGFELQGRVRAEGDKRIDLRKLSISLLNPHLPVEPGADQLTSGGSFVVYGVGPYTYRLAISGLSEEFYLNSVRLGDQQIAGTAIDLDIAEGPPGILEIVVSGTAGAVDGMVKNYRDGPASGAVVVLVPDSNRRQESGLFKDATTDQNGRFSIRGIRPGGYKLFAWDDIEPGIWWDPEFLSRYEAKGEDVKVEASGHPRVDLHLISTNPE